MREELEDELKKRLANYTEEPDDEQWARIVAQMDSPKSGAAWRGWAERGSYVLAGAVLASLYFLYQPVEVSKPESIIQQHDPIGNKTEENISSESVARLAIPQNETTSPQNEIVSNQHPAVTQVPFSNSVTPGSHQYMEVDQTISTQMVTGQIDQKNDIKEGQPDEHVTAGISEEEPVVSPKETRDPVDEKQLKKEEKAREAEKKAKERSREERNHQKFILYFTAMPTFGYQRIESNTSDNIIVESIKKIPTFSTNRLGIRAEFGAEIPVSKRIKFFGGLLYYQRNQAIDFTERVPETVIVPGPDGDVIIETEFTNESRSFEYELKNLGLQAGINYKLSQKKFLQTVGTGLEFQWALNKIDEDVSSGAFTNNPSAYVFYNLYYRLQYPAAGRLKAVFQPTLNYSFYINQDLSAPFYVKPYGLGLNIGCTYNF